MKRLAPLSAWLFALATLFGAAHELRRERDKSDMTAALGDVPGLNIQRVPLALTDYQAIQKKTPVSGTVEIIPAPDGLSLKAAAISDYAAWRLIIDQVLLDNQGVVWRIDYLCSGKCPSGEAHKAMLQGQRLSGAP